MLLLLSNSSSPLFHHRANPRPSPPKPYVRIHAPLRSPRPRTHLPSVLRPVALPDRGGAEEELAPPSAAAVAAAVRRASAASPVEFARRRVEEKAGEEGSGGVVMPSPDFRRLCVEQLQLFRMVVDRDAVLSVYVRPAGSYVMDQLELRQVAYFPGIDVPEISECIVLVANFAIPAGLRAAEAALLKQQVDFIPESRSFVLPMVKHPFLVGFLVAELPKLEMSTSMDALSTDEQLPYNLPKNRSYGLLSRSNEKLWEIQPSGEDLKKAYGQFTTEQRSRAIMISNSLAMAYVMDQKALLLQQTSWQNNVRMSHLVEQIRGPLASIRALAKMLSLHLKRTEIPYDIIEDILIQGDHMKDALQQIQDVVYLTKANIVRCNDEAMKEKHNSTNGQLKSYRSLPLENSSEDVEKLGVQKVDSLLPLVSDRKDTEMPMPPLWLIPLQQYNNRQTVRCLGCVKGFGRSCCTAC